MKNTLGRVRQPKRMYKRNNSLQSLTDAFASQIIRNTRTKAKAGKVSKIKVCTWGSQILKLFHQGKKEGDSDECRKDELSPASLFECSNGCLADTVIPGRIPDIVTLYMDDSIFVNIFENILECEDWCKKFTIKWAYILPINYGIRFFLYHYFANN